MLIVNENGMTRPASQAESAMLFELRLLWWCCKDARDAILEGKQDTALAILNDAANRAKVGAGGTANRLTFMPGSAICEHGYEDGKDCDVCYARWKAERPNLN